MDDDLVKDCSCYRYECHGKDYQEEDDGADRHNNPLCFMWMTVSASMTALSTVPSRVFLRYRNSEGISYSISCFPNNCLPSL